MNDWGGLQDDARALLSFDISQEQPSREITARGQYEADG